MKKIMRDVDEEETQNKVLRKGKKKEQEEMENKTREHRKQEEKYKIYEENAKE